MIARGGKLPRLWLIDAGGAACMAVLALVVWGIGVAPASRARAESARRHEEFDERAAHATGLKGALRRLEDRIASKQRMLRESPLHLEGAHQVNARLSRMTALASSAGLAIEELKPGSPRPEPRLTRVPLHLSARGPYRAVVLFLHSLKAAFPDVGLVGFEVTGDPGDGPEEAACMFDLVWFAASGGGAAGADTPEQKK
jgi:hypothetical protein